MKKIKLPMQLILCALISPVVFAGNGVLEINQTCATQLGCFNGDTPGFPVSINGTSGLSYQLTSNLVIPNVNTGGITVSASQVSIDLNGFSIIGIACVGSTTDCTPATGSGAGIAVTAASSDMNISNGSIIGMGADGIANLTGDSTSVREVRTRWNRTRGISIGNSSLVIDCRSNYNGTDGIRLGRGGIVRDSIASNNGGSGISAANASNIINNVVRNNAGAGISVAYISKITGNVSVGNTGNGISALNDANVQGNSVSSNGGVGLELGSTSMYLGNTISYNSGGTVTGFDFNTSHSSNHDLFPIPVPFNAGTNICEGNPCP